MKTKQLQVFSDPGHSWVKVKLSMLAKLGIENKISGCSYVRNDYVYLEEDCDAGILIEALLKAGHTVSFKTSWTNKSSKIRSYSQYTVEKCHDQN